MMKLGGLLTPLLFSLLAGCAALPPSKAYDGPVRDVRELAVIKISPESSATIITVFDGRGDRFSRPEPLPNGLEVIALPGKHTMHVRVSHFDGGLSLHGFKKITFDTEAGRTYLVHGQLKVTQLKPPMGITSVWLTVEGSDQVVAGTSPP